MPCCVRVAPALLLHVSLLLAMVSGAGLVTAARLKWDPTTYIMARELFPLEYHAACVALTAVSSAVLALSHVAALALSLPARAQAARRALLFTYATVMATLVCGQIAWTWWTGARISAWLESAQAAEVARMLEVREHLEPLLTYLSNWHPLPGRIQELIQEAEMDAPRNLYVGEAALVLVGVLQPLAALLALLSAVRTRRHTSAANRDYVHSETRYLETSGLHGSRFGWSYLHDPSYTTEFAHEVPNASCRMVSLVAFRLFSKFYPVLMVYILKIKLIK